MSLITPTFDNIPDLLRQRGAALSPLSEQAIASRSYEGVDSDCIFLTSPNNPTGSLYVEEDFRKLFEWAQEAAKVVIVDRSFALFDQRAVFDIYSLAAAFPQMILIVIEDTGKIFPSQDTKVALLVLPRSEHANYAKLYSSVAMHHSRMLLNVSPFSLAIVSAFLEDAQEGGLAYVREAVSANRHNLRAGLARVGLSCPVDTRDSRVSVDLVDVGTLGTASDVGLRLEANGVHVLPCDKFYWDRPKADSGRIRVALAREPESFNAAVDRLTELLEP